MGSGARVVGQAFQEEIGGGVGAAQRGWVVSGLILGGIKGDTRVVSGVIPPPI